MRCGSRWSTCRFRPQRSRSGCSARRPPRCSDLANSPRRRSPGAAWLVVMEAGWTADGHPREGVHAMRFGLFHLLRFPEPWSAEKEHQCLWECLEQYSYAEAMGFSTLWLTEHHFIPAWSMAGAPEVLLSAISQRTSTIRLGIAVVMSPIHHPLHTAVKIATLDLLSNGRVDLGLGRSTTPLQLAPFGVKMEDTRGMMEEALSIIPRIWTEEVFSHDGQYYHVLPCQVVPKPYQKPHPP